MWPAIRRVAVGLAVVGLAAWFVFLRPQLLGGPAAYITVSGVSMEPTLHAGDLVVMTSADGYAPGDVVAYRVPDGDPAAGRHVIHRIIGGEADEGYLLQGDNTDGPDRWRPTDDNIIGRQLIVLPAFGSVLMLLKTPAGLAGLAAALVVFALPFWGAAEAAPAGGAGFGRAAGARLASARAAKINVVTVAEGLLVNELQPGVACRAQVLVEFRNDGSDWAEVSAAVSTYSTIGADGSITAQGAFTSVHPRRVAPGETGFMLADVHDADLGAGQLVGASSVVAYRDARGWSPYFERAPSSELAPG